MPEQRRSLTGWMSRFDIAMVTKRRIALYGNTADLVLDTECSPPLLSMTEWLRSRFLRAGYCRVVLYDHATFPMVLDWDGLSPGEATRAFQDFARPTPMQDPSEPSFALNSIERLLNTSDRPVAAILSRPDLRIRYPHVEAVLFHRLTEKAAVAELPAVEETGGEPGRAAGRLQNLAVLTYANENSIPAEFITADPDTSLILVPEPNFEQRRAFFSGHLSEFHHEDGQVTSDFEQLARVTDGYRMSELTQLARLSRREEIPAGRIHLLLSLLRFGRKEDRWANLSLDTAEEFFRKNYEIRGQDEPVSAVVDCLMMAKHRIASVIDPNARKPPVVLFFVGSTGVGKTMIARCIADFLTGSPDSLKIIDMSEYRQEHSDQRLIGSPPGYVGFVEGGQLTNWVKERPFSVVLIDEVEKAHERILDLFLQILDGARLTDGKGETVDFSETCLVFTSNIGVEASREEELLDKTNRTQVRKFFKAEVERFFAEDIERPELFNRLKQGIVVFNFIPRETARFLLQERLKDLTERVNSRLTSPYRGVSSRSPGSKSPPRLRFSPTQDAELVDYLLEHVEYQQYGLRDVNTVIGLKVGPAIAKFMDKPRSGDWVYEWVAEAEDEESHVRIGHAPGAACKKN